MKKQRLPDLNSTQQQLIKPNTHRVFGLASMVLLLFSYTAKAQILEYIESKASLAEKIYLQLDANIYTVGNTVWFKSVVANAYDHIPSPLSGVLYVELIGPNETIIEEKRVKLSNGVGQGFFYLDESLDQGTYLIRAYTNWNKNFDSDFFFHTYIQVFAPDKENNTQKPITDITLVNQEGSNNRLSACFNPSAIDSMHKSKLLVVLTIDGIKDSLLLKKEKDGKFRMDHLVDKAIQMVTVHMQTLSGCSHSTTVVLNKDYLDLQFFPESGSLVHGITSKVGFKALDANGKGKPVEGDIMDKNGRLVARFKSNELGMGRFMLSHPDTSTTYYARLASANNEPLNTTFALPKVGQSGNVLSVKKKEAEISVTALSNYLKDDSICLRFTIRGIKYFDIKAQLSNGFYRISLPTGKLPEGIVLCTLLDDAECPLAERLFFNKRTGDQLKISVETDRATYKKREQTRLKVNTANAAGEPLDANLSVLVINKAQMGTMQQTRQNILSYFLLDSELKGHIENPGYYFRNDSTLHNDLDALMLTQGWRKYYFTKRYKPIVHVPEQTLTVSGQVRSALSKRKQAGAALTLMTFGKEKSFYTCTADSLGSFKFILGDEFGQNINALIQSTEESGEQKNYRVTLHKEVSPEISFNHQKSVQELDSMAHLLVEKNAERKKIDDAFPLQSGSILIEEVEVSSYRLTPERKQVTERFGEPIEIIDGKAIIEKEQDWSYGLYSVLMFNYPDKVIINRGSDGVLYARLHNFEMTLVVIDGMPVMPEEYELVPNIPPSEVVSFEIIEYADNFTSLYCTVHPPSCRFAPQTGNVIAIYTRGKKGLYGTNPPVGIMHTSIPVFSAHREFYAPKYDSPEDNKTNKPDLRALIHWEPLVATDSMGNATVSFYNADIPGQMLVVTEAISSDGKIGYREIEYEVEGKQEEFIILN